MIGKLDYDKIYKLYYYYILIIDNYQSKYKVLWVFGKIKIK
jgi:hypothetical protein